MNADPLSTPTCRPVSVPPSSPHIPTRLRLLFSPIRIDDATNSPSAFPDPDIESDLGSRSGCFPCQNRGIRCTVSPLHGNGKRKRCDGCEEHDDCCLFPPPQTGNYVMKLAKNCTHCQDAHQKCLFDTSDHACSRCIKLGLFCTFKPTSQGMRNDLGSDGKTRNITRSRPQSRKRQKPSPSHAATCGNDAALTHSVTVQVGGSPPVASVDRPKHIVTISPNITDDTPHVTSKLVT